MLCKHFLFLATRGRIYNGSIIRSRWRIYCENCTISNHTSYHILPLHNVSFALESEMKLQTTVLWALT